MKRLVVGAVLGAAVGFLVWFIVTLVGVWKGATTPTIVGVGVGVLTNLVTWLVPGRSEVGRYLKAFWDVWKMPPDERLALKQIRSDQEIQFTYPSRYLWAMLGRVNLRGVGTQQGDDAFVVVPINLVSCLMHEVSLRRMLGELEIGPIGSIQFEFMGVGGRRITSLGSSSWHQRVELTDAQLRQVEGISSTSPTIKLRLRIEPETGNEIEISEITSERPKNQG